MRNGDGPLKLGSAPAGVLASVWSLVAARWRHARGWRAGVLLALICLTVYVPGLIQTPPIDRDESRFAQASRQMFEAVALPELERSPFLHSGGVVIPMVQDKPRLNKPPLIYWLQAASAWLSSLGDPARDAIWMYRIPSLLCAIGAVMATWRLGCRMFDPRAAWLGAALLAVCPLVAFDAHQARADQLLLFSVVLSQAALWRVWNEKRASWPHAALFWLAISMGILAKGPIAPLIALLTVLVRCVFERSWERMRELRPAFGVLVIAACVGPWVWAVGERVGWASYWPLVLDETLGRSVEAKEGHWGPPGYHTLLLAALFWPGSLATLAAIVRAIRRGLPCASPNQRWKRKKGRAGELFCLGWILPAWIVFELVGTKLPHYTMPLYPAVALLSARGLLAIAAAANRASERNRLEGTSRDREPAEARSIAGQPVTIARAGPNASELAKPIAWLPWAIIGAVLSAAAPAFLWLLNVGPFPLVTVGLLGLAAVVLIIMACRAAARSLALRAQGLGVIAAVMALLPFFLSLMPRVTALSPRLIEHVQLLDPGRSRPLACSGYQEDSLVFATRGRIERVPEESIAEWAATQPEGIIVAPIESSRAAELLRIAGWHDDFRTRGVNLGRGKLVDVGVWTRGAK
ncbi:MAG: glycosyltransferase family 39 protein [Phycisphaerales bacterium]|jgi:4-amino-4-deoxy-L-arabinose transferase-like glycosyltransferase|nr:glycosyltransferase family 39 protein [Phycisphaerales bacterium]